ALAAGILLLRLVTGMLLGRRLLRTSRPTGRRADGVEIRESNHVSAPITIGVIRSAIVLPADWPTLDGAKMEAVLAHELSHVHRHDPAVQWLSSIHRAILCFNPLSWFLHRRIVRLAEDASDDAALRTGQDRTSYAELLLEFMQRGVRGSG